jgi:hypothetical protein
MPLVIEVFPVPGADSHPGASPRPWDLRMGRSLPSRNRVETCVLGLGYGGIPRVTLPEHVRTKPSPPLRIKKGSGRKRAPPGGEK